MARYIGPQHKLCRREGAPLCDSPKCPARGRRKYPPGAHGDKGYPRNLSIYGKQLRAKQRAKRMYGMMERQFRRTFREAKRLKGNTAENLLTLLESRLDNIIYRLGFADTRPQARQIVSHAHIMVNNKKIDVPSYIVRKEDVISLTSRASKRVFFQDRLAIIGKKERPVWLIWDDAKSQGKVVAEPEIVHLVDALEPNMVVELYSK